jgi:hypothetical protein
MATGRSGIPDEVVQGCCHFQLPAPYSAASSASAAATVALPGRAPVLSRSSKRLGINPDPSGRVGSSSLQTFHGLKGLNSNDRTPGSLAARPQLPGPDDALKSVPVEPCRPSIALLLRRLAAACLLRYPLQHRRAVMSCVQRRSGRREAGIGSTPCRVIRGRPSAGQARDLRWWYAPAQRQRRGSLL